MSEIKKELNLLNELREKGKTNKKEINDVEDVMLLFHVKKISYTSQIQINPSKLEINYIITLLYLTWNIKN